jgi:hypothetical protein
MCDIYQGLDTGSASSLSWRAVNSASIGAGLSLGLRRGVEDGL